MVGERVLTEWAQADRDSFRIVYGSGNCSCHLYPPCGSCTHPGNPHNQREDERCWKDPAQELPDPPRAEGWGSW